MVAIAAAIAMGCGHEGPSPTPSIIPDGRTEAVQEGFHLAEACPPGFELTDEGVCRLRNLYQQYGSLKDKGVGGLKTGLPPVRDGFAPQQIDLGRLLFFDPVLSKDSSLSCASCHRPDKGFTDGKARSEGVLGLPVGRSAPSLWNVAFQERFFWDARAATLEEQMQGPLFAADEMGNTPEQLLATLNGNAEYVRLFSEAFPDGAKGIALPQVLHAISAFETSLISLNSRYDQYAHGHHAALTQNEQDGLNVFRSFVARCAECHTPPLFTNRELAVIGTPDPDGMPFDQGAQKPTGDTDQRGAFKIPSLRNIAKTAPYMHSGRFATLREAAKFYTEGRGHAVPKGEKLKLHWHIWEPELSDRDLDLLVEFLHTLTDESLMPRIPKSLPSGSSPYTGWEDGIDKFK
ncbi:MAG: cytochrome-c peroxidase [Flavobacteriales bacterium]|nr:cytochrome-c peroxidase [Flavobacteriales bacterium]